MTDAIKEVVIYSTNTCPYCVRAKELMKAKHIPYREIMLDKDPAKRIEMELITGKRSVPQIFIGEHHVGGFDDLKSLNETGHLDTLLSQNINE